MSARPGRKGSVLLAVVVLLASAAGPGACAGIEELGWVIESALGRPPLAGAEAGIVVECLDTGEVLFERNPDSTFIPASNMKIVTGAAALRLLGPDFRFETEVLLDAGDSGPVTRGDLYVRGSGDPSFVSEEMWKLVEAVRLTGIEEIGGDIVLDATWFDTVATAGPDARAGDRAYHARTGALSLNFNSIAVSVGPGGNAGLPARVALAPDTDFVEVRNVATTSGRRSRRNISVRRFAEGGRNVIEVTGSVPAGSDAEIDYRSLNDPSRYFGTVLLEFLEKEGIGVRGAVREGAVPDGARSVHVHRSKPLALIVRDLNKFSNNFVAEQLTKALGAFADGAPGTTAGGIRALERFLEGRGLPATAFRVADGSGFSRANRLSPRTIVRVIREAHADFETCYEFLGSLSVSGADGTLEDRMRTGALPRSVRAKTGLLDGVTAISGVMETARGRRIVFSIILNGLECEAWRAHDFEHGLLLSIYGS